MIYEVKELEFAYPGREVLFEDVSFTLDEGEIITILGRNGAGKSTLMSCLMGEHSQCKGDVRLNDASITGMSGRRIARSVGFVPQKENSVFDYSVLDYVMMGCACDMGLFAHPGKKEREAAKAALEELCIAHLADRPFTQLSGGEQQQCTIARAIIRHPRAILFDEPTAHLDVANKIRLLRMIKELSGRGYGVIFSTHDPDQALAVGGKALLFEADGRVSFGSVEETVTEERLRSIYGDELKIAYLEETGRRVCFCRGF